MMKPSMLRSLHSTLSRISSHLSRCTFSSESCPERKVAILGAAGGIGQPLSLLMKLNPLVSSLSLYDIARTPGVAADVSHINTKSEVHSSLCYKKNASFVPLAKGFKLWFDGLIWVDG